MFVLARKNTKIICFFINSKLLAAPGVVIRKVTVLTYIRYKSKTTNSYGIWELSSDGSKQRITMYSAEKIEESDRDWEDININMRDAFVGGFDIDILTHSEMEEFVFLAAI